MLNYFSLDVHPEKVLELLGHSSIVLTLDTYSHLIPSMHSKTAKKMHEVFKS
jgi:integrase